MTFASVMKTILVQLFNVISILLSLFFVLMWVSLSFMEDDIKHDVNWFIMIKNRFPKQYDFYAYIKLVNLLFCLIYLVLSSWRIIAKQFHHGNGNSSAATTTTFSKLVAQLYMALAVAVFSMNALLLYLLQTIGHVVWEFFLITLPLSTVIVSSNILYLAAIITITISSMILYLYYNKISLCVFVMVHSLLIVLTVSVLILTSGACEACYSPTLSSRPSLTAHRGCPSEESLENSIQAFKRAATEYDSVITLESDVHVSSDGVLFLLHDDYFARTTSISDSCPHVDSYTQASTFYYYHSDDCPIKSLHLKGNPEQAVATFDSLLTIVKESGKNVMFDLITPRQKHPFQELVINLTLDSIMRSGINLEKIWWSSANMSFIYSKYPGLTLVAKSRFTSLHEFRQQNIKIANEQWNTSINTIRSLKEMGAMINMYTISTKPLLDYAWCLGVDSVATNNCDQFDLQLVNSLHEYCYSSWYSVGQYLIIIAVSAPLCCIGYIRWRKQFREHSD